MRIASAILGILGAIVSAILGVKWYLDSRLVQGLTELANAVGAHAETSALSRLVTSSYFLMANLVVGILGAVFVLKGKGKVGGPIMIVGAIVPVVFASPAIVFTALLLLGGVLGIFAKPKASAATYAAPAAFAAPR